LQEGWLKTSDELLGANGSRPLRQAFGHVKSLQPVLGPDPTFGDACGAVAAKLVFSGALCWAITGPLVQYREVPEDIAPVAGWGFLVWSLIAFFAGHSPAANIIRFLFLTILVAGLHVPFTSVLGGLVMHPLTLLKMLGGTFGAWIACSLIGSYFNGRFPMKVARKPIPEELQSRVSEQPVEQGAATGGPMGN
jgi:hypothetical protein